MSMQEALAEFDQGLTRNPKIQLRADGDHRIVLIPLDAELSPAHRAHQGGTAALAHDGG